MKHGYVICDNNGVAQKFSELPRDIQKRVKYDLMFLAIFEFQSEAFDIVKVWAEISGEKSMLGWTVKRVHLNISDTVATYGEEDEEDEDEDEGDDADFDEDECEETLEVVKLSITAPSKMTPDEIETEIIDYLSDDTEVEELSFGWQEPPLNNKKATTNSLALIEVEDGFRQQIKSKARPISFNVETKQGTITCTWVLD